MTRTEAKLLLRRSLQGRDFCLAVTEWCWASPEHGEVEYRVSVLPGLDGTQCSQHKGKSLNEAVDAVVAGALQVVAAEFDKVMDEMFG